MAHRFLRRLAILLVLLSGLCVLTIAEEDPYNADPMQPGTVEEYPTVDPSYFEETDDPLVNPFWDLNYYEWYYSDVMHLYHAGVISGFPDGTFRPLNNVTNGEALKMVLLASGYISCDPITKHWASGYYAFAIASGFISATGEMTDLDAPITRAMVCKLAANAIGAKRHSDIQPFTDTDDPYIAALFETGIISGYPDGTMKPENNLTRAELSAIVYRILTYREKHLNQGSMIDPGNLRTTAAGLEFIKAREGFVDKPMWDYSQYSVGYGSRCGKDDYPDGITVEQAELLLRSMIAEIEVELDAFIEQNGLMFTDAQYDALVSFSYNTGLTWLTSGSRLAVILAEGNYSNNDFASAFGIWCHITEDGIVKIHDPLLKRRVMEINLFLYGDYSGRSDNFSYLIFATDLIAADIALYENGSYYQPFFAPEEPGFTGWMDEEGELLTETSIVSKNHTVFPIFS